jgi:hypothetical protein
MYGKRRRTAEVWALDHSVKGTLQYETFPLLIISSFLLMHRQDFYEPNKPVFNRLLRDLREKV